MKKLPNKFYIKKNVWNIVDQKPKDKFDVSKFFNN